jgi:hypothetical protein
VSPPEQAEIRSREDRLTASTFRTVLLSVVDRLARGLPRS